jgi:hypothetical protein
MLAPLRPCNSIAGTITPYKPKDSTMNTHIRVIGAAALATAIMLIVSMTTPTAAVAQSPCVVQQVINQTGCSFNLCLYDAAGVVVCYPISGAQIVTRISIGTSIPVGVVDANGVNHPFVGLPSPGCTPCIPLTPAGFGCCGSVCYDEAACTFTINSGCPIVC